MKRLLISADAEQFFETEDSNSTDDNEDDSDITNGWV